MRTHEVKHTCACCGDWRTWDVPTSVLPVFLEVLVTVGWRHREDTQDWTCPVCSKVKPAPQAANDGKRTGIKNRGRRRRNFVRHVRPANTVGCHRGARTKAGAKP